MLLQGEQVEFTSLAGVGSVSVRKQALTAEAVGVVSAGTVMATVTPRPLYIVMTDQRLLLFDGDRGGRPGKVMLNLPRPSSGGQLEEGVPGAAEHHAAVGGGPGEGPQGDVSSAAPGGRAAVRCGVGGDALTGGGPRLDDWLHSPLA
ncbi:hypothetical protein AB0I51_43860 [Streptomyces sp. NPDC050549]|uniref:hypothetical protein n=1 Tax=Streptomyces sp. NPDC050549 TaxID=3155406 RepID=UPI00343CF5EE